MSNFEFGTNGLGIVVINAEVLYSPYRIRKEIENYVISDLSRLLLVFLLMKEILCGKFT